MKEEKEKREKRKEKRVVPHYRSMYRQKRLKVGRERVA